ncbi:MAG TPA: proton-conducting transporter membrane subunit [Anaerolineae bacterium]|nr:proton-conducting transporter membrane subunit [Anaerolineae bacterium]
MPLVTPLLPVIPLLLGAAILPLTSLAGSVRLSRWVAVAVSATALASCVLVYSRRPLGWTAGLWRPEALFGVDPGYYGDSLALAMVFLLTLVTLTAVLADDFRHCPERAQGGTLGAILLVAGAASSVILAADLVALCLSWGLLDVGVFVLIGLAHRGQWASRTAFRILTINYLAGVALLGGLLQLQAQGEIYSLQMAPLPTRVIALLMLAALLRLGLYPAFLGRAPGAPMRTASRTVWHVVPVTVGGYLLVRAASMAAVISLPGKELTIVLGSLAVTLSALGLWFETGLKRAAPYIVLNQAGHMALAAAMASPYSPAIMASQAVSLVLALTVLLVSAVTPVGSMSRLYEAWRRCCVWIAIGAVVATPLTLGFVGRQLLYRSLAGSTLAPLILVSLVANSLMAAPLLKIGLYGAANQTERGPVQPFLLGGLTVVSVPLVILGLHPASLGRLLGIQSALAPWPSLPELLISPDSATTAFLAVATIASLGLGYLMYRRGQLIVAKAGISLETLHTVAQMEWLFSVLGWLTESGTALLEQLGGFFEGRRSAGWILVFATLVALLLLSS